MVLGHRATQCWAAPRLQQNQKPLERAISHWKLECLVAKRVRRDTYKEAADVIPDGGKIL